MQRVVQLQLPNVSLRHIASADMLLVLDNGVSVLCHSQIMLLHSAVLCNLMKDSPRQHNGTVMLPLADFTETQCSALLAYLYKNTVSCKGAAFEKHSAAACDAAAAVARFARTCDMLHALRHVQAYMAAFLMRIAIRKEKS